VETSDSGGILRFDVLSRDLCVFDSHFLEASAGTGKTFAIEHLVVRLLLETDAPLSLDQILVVTFTRAATAELKMRIYRNLKAVQKQLVEKNSPFDYVQALIERQEELRALERIEAALICYDLAPIYTLHGFCSRMLQELAFEAKVKAETVDPEKQPSGLFVERWIKEHLKSAVKEPSYSLGQMRILLKRKDPARLIATLKQLVEGSKKLPSLPSYQELLEAFQKQLSFFEQIDPELLQGDFQVLIPRYVKMTGSEIPSQVALLCKILSSQTCSNEEFECLLEEELFIERMQEQNLKKKAKPLLQTELQYPHLLERLRKEILPLIRKARDPASLLLRLAADVRAQVGPLLEEKEILSFDALLLKMREALQDERFVRGVRSKFRAAIIDEFQDTDPVQWELFKTLFPPGEGSTLYLVGDPKQSIYAFRSADLHVYLDAASEMGPQARRFLDTNFRSTPPLVEALNALFGAKEWMQDLDVLPLQAGSSAGPIDQEPPIEFWVATQKKGRSRAFPSSQVLESCIFPQIASRLHSLNQEQGIAYDEMAILVKDRFAAQEVSSYLIQAGIPVSAHRTSSLIDSSAYFSLRLIAEALKFPSHDGKLRAALGSPLIGFSVAEIQGREFVWAKTQMKRLEALLSAQGFGPFLQALFKTKWRQTGRSLLEEIITQKQLYEDLRQLGELILEEAPDLDLSEYLSSLPFASSEHEGRFQRKSQEEKGSVAVMTIHRSKGLEFQIVFALGISARHPLSDLVTIRTPQGAELSPLDFEDPACQKGLEEVCAEKLRTLYVCLTRAKQKLFIPLILEEEPQELDLVDLSPLELFLTKSDLSIERLTSLHPLIRVHPLEPSAAPHFAPERQTVELLPPTPLLLPPLEPLPLSFTALAAKHTPMQFKIQETPPSIHTLPLGSETGVVLHRIFEKMTKKGLHHPLNPLEIGQLLEREVAGSDLELWLPVLNSWIPEVLTQPLLGFCIADIPRDQLLEEMEFVYALSHGLMKGFADLIFAWQGKYYILDWKSNYLGPSDADYTPEALERAMTDNDYKLQASIYAEALRRYVKLFDNRPFEECFGGALYYFIRGKALYHFIPHLYE
jgi:exodeoxyribonuclease V beta subunit